MALQLVGEAAVAAFLQSVLRDLAAILRTRHTTPFVDDLNPELKKLVKKLSRFQDLLVDGETRRLAEKSVDEWMDDLKELVYNVDDILDEIKYESTQTRSIQVSVDLSHVYRSFNTIKSMLCGVLNRTDLLFDEAKILNLRRGIGRVPWGQSQAIRHRPETSPSIDKSEIHGREEDIKSIIDMLLETNVSAKKNYDVIFIVGMGGLGKTTLAQLIYRDQEVERHFDVKSWACISDVFDVSRATRELIENSRQAGGAHGLQSLAALQDKLERIVENRRILFVLDDVWTAKEWDKMKAPLSSCASGSKILVTTRINAVALAMSNRSQYHLGVLDHEQCWAIFKDKAFGEIDKDYVDQENLKKLGDKIVRKCGGVPLAVKVIGSMLRGAEEERWKAVLENALWDTAYEDDEILPAMRLSYHYLPASLKRCFEYFAIFSSDYKLDQHQLVRMWIAEGLVQDEEGRMAEDIGNEYYNDLKGRSLIQENDMLHDITHHLSCMVSKKFCYHGDLCEPPVSVRHAYFDFHSIEEVMNFEFLEAHRCLRTLIFYVHSTNRLPNKIWSCKMLRVLNLTQGRSGISLELPSSIGDLKHLRYLRLCAYFSYLPNSICKLGNLQLLDLNGCEYLTQLPPDIGSLQSLRVLTLWGTPAKVPESIVYVTGLQELGVNNHDQLPPYIGGLTGLEALPPYHVGTEKGRGIGELKDMNRLKGKLTIASMENIGGVVEASMADLKNKKHVEELEFSWSTSTKLVKDEDADMEVKIVEVLKPHDSLLSLAFFNYSGNKLPVWIMSSLCNLTHLVMEGLNMVNRMVGMEFASLIELKIKDCPLLREVLMATPKLMKLEVKNCRELQTTSLVTSLSDSASRHLIFSSQLKCLECDCHVLERLIQQLEMANSWCTKLKKLTVMAGGVGVASLPRGWPSILKSLETLEIVGIDQANFQLLNNGDGNASLAPSLWELKLVNWFRMAQLPSDLCNLTSLRSLQIHNFPGLVSFELQELPPDLRHLYIFQCTSLTTLPVGFIDFTSLESVSILLCDNLVIFQDEMIPRTAKFTALGCRLFSSRSSDQEYNFFPNAPDRTTMSSTI